MGDMRTTAEIKKLALAVEAERLMISQSGADMVRFELLIEV